MNNFEVKFFSKYVAEGQEIKGVVHQHWIKIIGKILFILLSFVFIPCFIYYFSIRIRENVPFYYLEIYLFLVYLKLIYEVFDWYNDVWIITNEGIVDLKRAIFKTDINSIKYENIEGIEVEQNGFIDVILKKGDIVIHKIGEEAFVMGDVMIPYNALNEIEKISKEKEEINEEGNTSDENKFDIIMNALSGVVENYLEKNKINKKKEEESSEFINKIVNRDDTLDLRN